MLHYILQTIAFQLFFLIVYDAFLKKETFFNWNRLYLLSTAFLSVLLPFVKIDGLKNVIPQQYVVTLPEIILGQKNTFVSNEFVFNMTNLNVGSAWSWNSVLYLGTIVMSLLLIYKIIKVVLLISKSPRVWRENFVIVKLLNSNAAFSFFHYVFLGEQIKIDDKESILSHEIVHVKQKHTLDLLFFEILRVLFWFNPLVYMYQSRIANLHEYIADEKASKNNNTQYYENLLAQVFDVKQISLVNPFFKQSLIKKRIIMLSKSKSKQINLIKYVLLVPMVIGMLVYTSCAQEKEDIDQPAVITVEGKLREDSSLVSKIAAIKSQLQIQGNTSDNESNGLSMLLKTIQSETLDTNLVKDIQSFTNAENKTALEDKISDVFEQIQIQGNISDEEYKKLKTLLLLTTEDGFENPFFDDVVKYAEVPFGVIDHVPVFPGCENKSDKKSCFIDSVTHHVSKNFNTKLADNIGLKGVQKIVVKFIIDNDGSIVDVKARAPHPELTNEAIRVVKSIPKMIPGTVDGKRVKVPFSLPIKFQIKE